MLKVSPSGLSSDRYLLWSVAAMLCLAAIALCAYPLLETPVRISRDYNEGWNAFQVARLMSGGPLYPVNPYVANNYPPLSFLIVAAVTTVTKDAIVAERLVSLLCLLATALNIGLVASRLTQSKALGAFAFAYFLAFVGIWFNAWVAMADPQWIGHALQTTGLWVLVRGGGKSPSSSRLAACAMLMCLGGLVKHNLVVLPLSVTIWLFWRNHREALRFLGFGVLSVIVAVSICLFCFGASIFDAILGHARVMAAANLTDRVSYTIMALAPSLMFLLATFHLARNDARVWFIGIYFSLAAGLGVLSRVGTGVDFNAYFDAGVAGALAASLLAHVASEAAAPARRSAMTVALTLLIATTLVSDVSPARETFKANRALHAQRAEAQSLIDVVRAVDGPVACEQLAYCYWAGKDFEIDFFNYGQKVLTSRVDEGPLAARFETGYYKLLIIGKMDDIERYFGDGRIARAIRANYAAETELASMIVLRPKRAERL